MTPRLRLTLVAFFFHVPGLLALRAALPPGLLVPNVIAAATTALGAIALGWRQPWTGVAVWAVGHVVWGAILAVRVWRHATPPPA